MMIRPSSAACGPRLFRSHIVQRFFSRIKSQSFNLVFRNPFGKQRDQITTNQHKKSPEISRNGERNPFFRFNIVVKQPGGNYDNRMRLKFCT